MLVSFRRGFLSFSLWFFCCGFGGLSAGEALPRVVVSIAPYKFFVEKIAGETLQPMLLVPSGVSLHSYEPTPQQVAAVVRADLWFYSGELFEQRAVRVLRARGASIRFIDLREGIDLLEGSAHQRVDAAAVHAPGCCGAVDLHIWLSLRNAQQQVRTIAKALIERYPQHAEQYGEAAQRLIVELQQLDESCRALLAPYASTSFLVVHPAYGYFARDYQLQQLSLEEEGKEMTPRQVEATLRHARDLGLTTLFTQKEYPKKVFERISSQIGMKLVELHPYGEEYFSVIVEIAKAFAVAAKEAQQAREERPPSFQEANGG